MCFVSCGMVLRMLAEKGICPWTYALGREGTNSFRRGKDISRAFRLPFRKICLTSR